MSLAWRVLLSHPSLLTGIVCSLALAACSHYGFADSDDAPAASTGPPVGVWTVASPAHEGLDTAKLTRALVDRLAQRGVSARWASQPEAASVRCSVQRADVSGFDSALFATAKVACDVGRAAAPARRFEASGRFTSTSAVDDPVALPGEHAAILEAAALEAVETVGVDIARWHNDSIEHSED
jgi:hypothetical protein